MGDMWSTMLVSVLFWSVAGLVVSLQEAKSYYPVFSLDFAGIGAGLVGLLCVGSVKGLILMVVAIGGLQMWLLRVFNARYPIRSTVRPKADAGPAPSAWRNPVVLLFGVVVFSFEFSDNFLDVMWKWKVSVLHSAPESYSTYMTNRRGVCGDRHDLFVARPLAARAPWIAGALATPIILLLTASSFLFTIFVGSPLEVVVACGAYAGCGLQIGKYTFFDNSKELALLVQSNLRTDCLPSFADGFMGRVGKASSCFVQQAIFVFLFNVQLAYPMWGGALVLVSLLAWIAAVFRLNPYIKHRMRALQSSEVPVVGEIGALHAPKGGA